MNETDFQADIIDWNWFAVWCLRSQLVGELGGVLELTLMPTIAVSKIPDSFYPTFAAFARSMNAKYGVPIILRFMHEV